MQHQKNLTEGNITAGLWAFAVPLMLGNVMQQLYNLVDTWVVGRYIGPVALGAVGASYTLMTFLTSIIIGLCLGNGSFIAMAFGRQDRDTIRNGLYMSVILTVAVTVVIIILFYLFLTPIIACLQVPIETREPMRVYLFYVFFGFFFTYIYNYVTNVLRGIGNSVVPLVFLGVAVVLNSILDMTFIVGLSWGIRGAAVATVISQVIAGAGLLAYFLKTYPEYRLRMEDRYWHRDNFRQILQLSGYTCLQQSVMNFGILVVQGIVNSFGTAVMAAFAVAVKIDTIAYMPVQDFGNAFSVFVAQNFGAGKKNRIREGIRQSAVSVTVFCLVISTAVFVCAEKLMTLFVSETESGAAAIIAIGVGYLRIEGACYLGIGLLFMLYGYYRAVKMPKMSLVLTVISLGTRVLLAYSLSRIPSVGVIGIWVAIPIGWVLADSVGIAYGWIKTR